MSSSNINRIPDLKKAFLDFFIKMKSPDFIVPEEGVYEKQAVIEEPNQSFERLKENTISGSVLPGCKAI